MKRIAPEYAQKTEKGASERPIALDGSYGIFRTRRIETATLRKIRRYGCLVKPYERD